MGPVPMAEISKRSRFNSLDVGPGMDAALIRMRELQMDNQDAEFCVR